MSHGLGSGNPTIVSAFHAALLHQLLVLLLIAAVLAVTWNVLRTVQYRRATRAATAAGAPAPAGAAPPAPGVPGPATGAAAPDPAAPEPLARRVLRVGFGLFWVLDGLLQLQAAMPLGLPSGVIRPAASASPGWVQHLVSSGITIWSNHPVPAAAATVWIQAGIGLWLLVAPRGLWSRTGGLVSAGWGLIVWAFGESFGGLFAPGLSWALGAPGAVIFYVVAGLLVALPERSWDGRRLGRRLLLGLGAFFVGMAVLQAWPGRGFWQGRLQGTVSVGTLDTMVRQMAQTPQLSLTSSWVGAFASFDAAHGWAVNLFLVVALAAVGIALCSGRPSLVRAAAVTAVVLCVADWLLVQDLGFFGGVGTDPNSMLPMALLVVVGYVALVRAPAPAAIAATAGARPGSWLDAMTPGYALRVVAGAGAAALVLVGTVPMLAAAADPNADPILSEAVNGTPNVLDTPAAPFSLVDQRGRAVTLAGLRGKTVALTFLDPVCTSDCPIIAQEFRQADARLGPAASTVEFVAIVANPVYRSTAFTNAFDAQEGLDHVRNWLYLTGSPAALAETWSRYGVQVQTAPGGAMVAHSDLAYVIDGHGRTRAVLGSTPGLGQPSSSSFATLLDQRIQQVATS